MTDLGYTLRFPNRLPLPPESVEEVRQAGTQLAYDAAAHSDDPEYLRRLFEVTIDNSAGAYWVIFTAACDVLITEILQPALLIAAEHGRDLRPMLREIAATRPDRDEQ